MYVVHFKKIGFCLLFLVISALTAVLITNSAGGVFFYKAAFSCVISPLNPPADAYAQKALAFFNLGEKKNLLCGAFPALAIASGPRQVASGKTQAAKNGEAALPQKTAVPQTKEISIVKGDETDAAGLYIKNATDYTVNASELLAAPLDFTYNPGQPQVLIVHTHTSESYLPSPAYDYVPTDNSRTEDTNFNVARVGDELEKYLKEAGINVIHDNTINDYPSYNGAYQKTMGLIESYTQKYPSLQVVIDLHRDSMETADGVKMRPTANISGEAVAQVMVVIGTDANGLTHPNWRTNLSWGLRLMKEMNAKYPGLARPLDLRCERFNGHLAQGEMILEFGTTGNTIEEALLAAKYTADCLAAVIKSQ